MANQYHKTLIQQIKNTGQELINRADSIIKSFLKYAIISKIEFEEAYHNAQSKEYTLYFIAPRDLVKDKYPEAEHSTISLELTTRTTKENDKVIKLNVYEFCQNCVEFEPQVTQRPEQLYSDFGVFCLCGDTIIECERRRHCEAIYKYLKKENEEEK